MRIHPTYKTKYRVENWASYDRALVQRGNVTVWVSPEAIASWEPAGGGRRGGQWKYSDLAIETALTLRHWKEGQGRHWFGLEVHEGELILEFGVVDTVTFH